MLSALKFHPDFIFACLITNAIQYTPAGGWVTVCLSQEDHQALIQVQDTGIGVASQDQPRIFERFYRVNSDRSRQTGGAGLGLAIAQAIANAHQGNIGRVSTAPAIFGLRANQLKAAPSQFNCR